MCFYQRKMLPKTIYFLDQNLKIDGLFQDSGTASKFGLTHDISVAIF